MKIEEQILPTSQQLEEELNVPVITSNQASIWDIGEFFGAHNPVTSKKLGRLFQSSPIK